jgi:hypothetical protein
VLRMSLSERLGWSRDGRRGIWWKGGWGWGSGIGLEEKEDGVVGCGLMGGKSCGCRIGGG